MKGVSAPLFCGDEVVWEVGVEERRHGIQKLPHRPLPHPGLRHEVDAQRALARGGTQRQGHTEKHRGGEPAMHFDPKCSASTPVVLT